MLENVEVMMNLGKGKSIPIYITNLYLLILGSVNDRVMKPISYTTGRKKSRENNELDITIYVIVWSL